jgi:hypothetical protein
VTKFNACTTTGCSRTRCATTSTRGAERGMACSTRSRSRSPTGASTATTDRVEMMSGEQPRGRRRGHAEVPFGATLYIEREDFMEDAAQEVLPPQARGRGPPALRLLDHVHEVVKDDAGEVGRAEVHLRPADPRRRLPAARRRGQRAQGQGHDPLGQRDARRATPRCGCSTASSRAERPGKAGDHLDDLNPDSLEVDRRRRCSSRTGATTAAERGLGHRRVRRRHRAVPVRAAGLLLRGAGGERRGPTGVQPDRDAAPSSSPGSFLRSRHEIRMRISDASGFRSRRADPR